MLKLEALKTILTFDTTRVKAPIVKPFWKKEVHKQLYISRPNMQLMWKMCSYHDFRSSSLIRSPSELTCNLSSPAKVKDAVFEAMLISAK